MAGNRQVSNVKVSPFSLLGSEEFKNADKLLSLGTELYNLKQNTLAFLAAAPKTGVQTNIQNFPKPLSQQVSLFREILPGLSCITNSQIYFHFQKQLA